MFIPPKNLFLQIAKGQEDITDGKNKTLPFFNHVHSLGVCHRHRRHLNVSLEDYILIFILLRGPYCMLFKLFVYKK